MCHTDSNADETYPSRSESRGAAGWLNLAATPVFAIMALLAGIPGGDQPGMHAAAGHHASPLSGMVLMYVLMSIFHVAPWLRLISRRRRMRHLQIAGQALQQLQVRGNEIDPDNNTQG